MNKPLSNVVKGMVVGMALTAAAVIITSKSATQKVKTLAERTADNVTTMFKMN